MNRVAYACEMLTELLRSIMGDSYVSLPHLTDPVLNYLNGLTQPEVEEFPALLGVNQIPSSDLNKLPSFLAGQGLEACHPITAIKASCKGPSYFRSGDLLVPLENHPEGYTFFLVELGSADMYNTWKFQLIGNDYNLKGTEIVLVQPVR